MRGEGIVCVYLGVCVCVCVCRGVCFVCMRVWCVCVCVYGVVCDVMRVPFLFFGGGGGENTCLVGGRWDCLPMLKCKISFGGIWSQQARNKRRKSEPASRVWQSSRETNVPFHEWGQHARERITHAIWMTMSEIEPNLARLREIFELRDTISPQKR